MRTLQNETLETINNKFFYCNKFDSLAIGCLIGHLYATKSHCSKFLYNKIVFAICTILAIVCWGGNIELQHFNDEFMSVLFAVVILNVCTNDELHINIENRVIELKSKYEKNMITLVSILSIFIAVSIGMISGISFSLQAFESISHTNILSVCLITCVVGFVIYNLFYALFKFVCKIIGIDFDKKAYFIFVDTIFIALIAFFFFLSTK